MNKKLMALALLACLAEQGVANAGSYMSSDNSCCPVAQPACCPETGRSWRLFKPRPYRTNCCPSRRACRPKRVRTYRAKRSCCPRVRCCRPKPTCCPQPAQVCEAPACIQGQTYAQTETVVEAQAPMSAEQPETVMSDMSDMSNPSEEAEMEEEAS